MINNLNKTTLTHRIATHTSIQLIGRIISYAISLFIIILITRYLGTEGFGDYTTITVFVASIAVLAEFGINQSIIKEYFSSEKKERTFANGFALRVFFSLGLFVLGALASYLFPYSPVVRNGIWIMAFATFFSSTSYIFTNVFQIFLKMHYSAIAEVLGKALILILNILIIRLDLGLYFLIISIVFGNILTFFLAYFWAKKLIKIRLKFDFGVWRRIFIKSIAIGISVILTVIILRIDIIILSVLKTNWEVGIYGASYKVLEIVRALPAVFCGLLFPILANYYANKKRKTFNITIQKGYDVLFVTGIWISTILLALSGSIILAIAGNEFTDSIPALQVLSFSALLIFLAQLFGTVIVAGDKQKTIIIPYVLVIAFNIALNLYLIPKFSFMGAAYATLITQIFSFLIPLVLIIKFFKTRFSLKNSFKAIFAGFVMFVFFILVQKYNIAAPWQSLETISTPLRLLYLLIITLIGSAIYLLILYFWGSIRGDTITKMFKIQEDE